MSDTYDRNRHRLILQRLLAISEAQDQLIPFTQLMMPTPKHPDDAALSLYTAERFHRVMAAGLEELEKGTFTRLVINLPPRHGKTQLASKSFIPWYVGRNPGNSVIFGTYNEKFSGDIGRAVRDIMHHPAYAQVFPDVVLKQDSQAADRLETTHGGVLAFVGRGGTTTGRGGDILIVDDPTKDRQEADSPTLRDTTWTWFTQILGTRMMDDRARVLLIQCMTGDTPVLMADGLEKPLRYVRAGDTVATYENGAVSTAMVTNWKNQGPDCVFTIRTTSGSTVKANGRHPFLVEREGVRAWLKVREIRLGDQIVSVVSSGRENSARMSGAERQRSARGIATHTTTRPDGLAEFGRHRSMPSLGVPPICGTDTGLAWRNTTPSSRYKAGSAPFVNSYLRGTTPGRIGAKSFASIMTTPLGGSEDCSATIVTSRLDTEKQKTSCSGPLATYGIVLETVVEIAPAGREDVFDIEVERTANFIANGLVSHNTRWHEDDIVGRLTDPKNDYYDAEVAEKWKIIELPALAREDDVLGRKEGEALWPSRFGVPFLKDQRRQDPRGFSALYQGRPSPETGAFFKAEWLKTYTASQLPKGLRYYCSSDHAVSTKQGADKTVLMAVGVDEDDNIYVLPDTVVRRMEAASQVEAMLAMIRNRRPLFWWAERSQISKSLGPFLRKRMLEEGTFCSIVEVTPLLDKQSRAQSIQARMSMGKVFFPATATWWSEARDQILKFPHDAHDDFVDSLAYIGLGLGLQTPYKLNTRPQINKPGTFGFLKQQRAEAARQARNSANGGW